MEILRMPTDGLIAVAPPDWQILQLYSLGGLASHLYTASPVHLWEPWTLQKHLFNTGAYLINREGMQQVQFEQHVMSLPCLMCRHAVLCWHAGIACPKACACMSKAHLGL